MIFGCSLTYRSNHPLPPTEHTLQLFFRYLISFCRAGVGTAGHSKHLAYRGNMRSFVRFLFLNLLVMAITSSSLFSQTMPSNQQPIQNPKASSDIVVVECVAERLGMQPKDVRPDLSIAKQSKPGDDLDFIEILMAIEETLNIEINDDLLSKWAGVDDSADLAESLTIKQLQSFVKNAITQ
jgi:acyl carrier protein